MSPETAAEAEREAEEKAAEAGAEAASQGASDADALTEEGLLLPLLDQAPRLSTSTWRRTSARRRPTGWRHPRAKPPPPSKENAGPGKPAPQGQVSGSVACGDEKEEQVCDE